jgi:dTDP-4-amino-4,6-dideoxygalactose transaminase
MDPSALAAAITSRTKAIVPVHLHGRLAEMSGILDVARKHGLAVIEDASQAHGAELFGKKAGTFGDIGCFSFYPGKNLGACGEGGAIVTDRPDFAEKIRVLRDWGQVGKYNHVEQGYNYRMDALQAAVLRVKLRHLPAWTERRREAANLYHSLLDDLELVRPAPGGFDHVYHVYAVSSDKRDFIRARMTDANISTGIHYPKPVHLQPAYRGLGFQAGSLAVSEELATQTLSLPIFPEITADQIQIVAAALADICGKSHARAA